MKAPLSWFITLSLAVAIGPIGSIVGSKSSAQASIFLSTSQSFSVAQYAPPAPPSRSAPGTGRGAASRGCLLLAKNSPDQDLNSLIALVPETQGRQGTEVWGYTAVEHPTFWFYVPYQSSSIAEMEFVLNDDQDKTLYKFPVPISSKAGIIRFQLPTTAALQPGKMYNWFFKVRGKSSACTTISTATAEPPNSVIDASDAQRPVNVEGWIQHIPPSSSLATRLQQASLEQQAALYGENGYWFDALNAIATEHLAKPTDTTISASWTTLLKQGGLEKLATQPLLK